LVLSSGIQVGLCVSFADLRFLLLVFNQIQSTKNLSKITSSMKMVSAAKLKGDENRLARAVPFNGWTSELGGAPKLVEGATFDELPQKVLIVPFTSDKGLCGGVNSYITRAVRNCIKKLQAQGKDADIVLIGDKGRAQLRRFHPEKIVRSATDVVTPGTYALASGLASELIASGAASDYDAVVIIYNSFVNAATYNQMYKVVTPFVTMSETEESLSGYEFDGDKAEAMEDLYEYMLASQVFHSFMDSAASEQSSRMTAMENASKNANEMVDSLTLKYNRARQSRITTELIEIISGASALDG
jgi:F-type H+-transporting ATPase subunit gamma